MSRRAVTSLVVTGLVCAVTGTAFGISSGVAASTATSSAEAAGKRLTIPQRRLPGGPLGGFGVGGIHSETTLPDKDGSGFITVTSDAGTLQAIDGMSLTLKQGTATETFAEPTLTVTEGTVVVRNGRRSSLTNLAVGDRVRITYNGTKWRVQAASPAWMTAIQRRYPSAATDTTIPSWPTV
jgi:hypothetical protein